MSTTAVRCLRAVPTGISVSALLRRKPLSATVAATLARKESGGCLQPPLRPVVAAIAASPDLASLGRRIDGDGLKWELPSPVQRIDGDGLKWGLLVSPQANLPMSSFVHKVHAGGDGKMMAALTEMVAVNRNARRPKKVSMSMNLDGNGRFVIHVNTYSNS